MVRPACRTGGAVLVAATCAGAGAVAACSLVALDGLSGSGSEAGAASDATGSDRSTADGAPPPEASADGAVRCGSDAGIFCDGACVDPTTDPANCGACGHACPSGRCGSSIIESMVTQPVSWALNGSAFYNPTAPSTELTAVGNGQAGSLVYLAPVVVDAFDAQFEFRMGLQGGTRADGMGFILEKNGPTALGSGGGGLGMGGLDGYGVELDIFDNKACGDVSADHVGVDALSQCTTGPTSLVSRDVTPIVDLADSHWHTAEVLLANGAVTVSIDGHAIVNAQPLPSFQTGMPYYLGFAGATGGTRTADGGPGGYRQEVKSIAITFPTARCL